MIFASWEELNASLKEEKSLGKRIVFTNGCFDLIHPGHVDYLEKSKQLGDILVVALNTDLSVQKLKGPTRPVNNQKDRAIIMNALKPVDYVTYFAEETPLEIVQTIKPDIITKGGDYKEDEVVGGEYIKKYGGKVEIIPFIPNKSSTKIIERMK